LISKQVGRKRARKKLEDSILDPDSYSEKVWDLISFRDEYKKAKSIFIYLSMKKEVPTRYFIKKAIEDNKKIYIPKINSNKTMTPVEFFNGETLYTPDLTIVPCLAVDKNGNRLGYGGGYYDKFLENYKGEIILLCYKELIFRKIYTEKHDVKIKNIIAL
jgi:5-formyltetrahydrofolate cyclo-ligase